MQPVCTDLLVPFRLI